MTFSPIAQAYAQLGAMVTVNTLFCWYPIWHWSTYTDTDPRDGVILLFGLCLAFITWLWAPAVILQAWKQSSRSTKSLQHRMFFLLISCGVYSPLWILIRLFTGKKF